MPPAGSRTPTGQILSLLPLPIGLHGQVIYLSFWCDPIQIFCDEYILGALCLAIRAIISQEPPPFPTSHFRTPRALSMAKVVNENRHVSAREIWLSGIAGNQTGVLRATRRIPFDYPIRCRDSWYRSARVAA